MSKKKQFLIKLENLSDFPDDFFDSLDNYGWEPREISKDKKGVLFINSDADLSYIKEFFDKYYPNLNYNLEEIYD